MHTERNINDYLFDELLIEIFTYLTGYQRLKAQTVCQRWLNLLRHHPKFRIDKYFRLYFNGCTLDDSDDPAKTFLESLVEYDAIRIGQDCTITDNCHQFWKKFERIEYLDISQVDMDCNSMAIMLSYMKNLKVLKISIQQSFFGIEKDHSLVLNLSEILSPLEELRILFVDCFDYESLTRLVGMCRNLKRLYLGVVHPITPFKLQEFLHFLQTYETIIKSLTLDWGQIQLSKQALLEKFESLPNLHLDEFTIRAETVQYVWSTESILKCVEISLDNPWTPPHITNSHTVHKIMPSGISFKDCVTSFEKHRLIYSRRELTKLDLTDLHPVQYISAYTGKMSLLIETLQLPSLAPKPLSDFFRNLSQTYPNLTDLHMRAKIDERSLVAITKHFKMLTSLTMENFCLTEDHESILENVEKVNPRLKSLSLDNLDFKSQDVFGLLGRLYPNVKLITVDFHKNKNTLKAQYDFKDTVSVILEKNPELTALWMKDRQDFESKVDVAVAEGLVQDIIDKGKNLKSIEAVFFPFTNEQGFRLFHHLPSLATVLNLNRRLDRSWYNSQLQQRQQTNK